MVRKREGEEEMERTSEEHPEGERVRRWKNTQMTQEEKVLVETAIPYINGNYSRALPQPLSISPPLILHTTTPTNFTQTGARSLTL